ncbi:MAG TPA: lasso peptide biosynthesis B2 protein [Trueperaceae bacterium]
MNRTGVAAQPRRRRARLSLDPRRLGSLAGARRLTAGEWRMVLLALPVVLSVRWALTVTTLARAHARIVERPPGSGRLAPHLVDGWSRAVARASRLVPGATCLTQALALQRLLRRQGQDSRVEIGFIGGGETAVEGHAWLVCGERVVIGGTNSKNFTRTMTLEG